MNTNWETPLFTIGDYKICLFSYLMAPCAMAYARSQLDDSNIVFNLSCTCLPLNRWLIRTAYGINGDTMEDVATSVCCFPCTVNQMLHTTIARGNPTSDGGMLQNFEKWEVPLNKVHTKGTYYNGANILYSLFCFPCAVGTAMENSVGEHTEAMLSIALYCMLYHKSNLCICVCKYVCMYVYVCLYVFYWCIFMLDTPLWFEICQYVFYKFVYEYLVNTIPNLYQSLLHLYLKLLS